MTNKEGSVTKTKTEWEIADDLGIQLTKLLRLSGDAVMARTLPTALGYIEQMTDKVMLAKSTLNSLKSAMIKRMREEGGE